MNIKFARKAGVAAIALMVAACTPPASDSSKSTEAPPIPSISTGATTVQPGQWRTTVTIVESNIPGAPPAAAAAAMAKPFVDEACSTADDVKDFARKNLTDQEDGTTCASNTLVIANGNISGHSQCQDSDGQSRTMVVDGSFTPTHVEMNMSLTGTTPMGPMSQKMHLVADRIGAC